MGASELSPGIQVLRFVVACSFALALTPVHAQVTPTIVAGLAPQANYVAGLTSGRFRVNESGAATLSIPIQAAPGVGGLAPQLALSYNSQAGNGRLGAGWTLSGLSIIRPCNRTIAQDGSNGGIAFAVGVDRYCLDGQRLVMVSGASYGADGAEYRTERETFTKIVSFGSSTSPAGPLYFKAWTKAGLVLEFGNTTDSKLKTKDGLGVLAYAVDSIADTNGNVIKVIYANDSVNGDLYPLQVSYAGGWVQFTYEARTDNKPVFVGLNPTPISTQTRLSQVESANTFGRNGLVRKYYFLSYYSPPDSGPSLLTSVLECDGPPPLTGASAPHCLEPYLMVWQTGNGGTTLAAPVNWGAPVSPGAPPRLGDINGDGLADMVYPTAAFGTPSLVAHLSNGSGFRAPVVIGSADYYIDPTTGAPIMSPIACRRARVSRRYSATSTETARRTWSTPPWLPATRISWRSFPTAAVSALKRQSASRIPHTTRTPEVSYS